MNKAYQNIGIVPVAIFNEIRHIPWGYISLEMTRSHNRLYIEQSLLALFRSIYRCHMHLKFKVRTLTPKTARH